MTSNIGSLVFIKNERDKNKARDRYIIVSIDKNHATLQKLTDRFMAKRYTVPLNRLYPASITPPVLQAPLPSDDDDSDDDCMNTIDHQPNDIEISEEDEEEEEGTDSDNDQVALGDNQVATAPRASNRERQQPAWMRSGEYVLK